VINLNSEPIESISDLVNGPIQDISIALWQSNILLRVVRDTYFDANKEALDNDIAMRTCFVEAYEEIQVLITVICDIIFESCKKNRGDGVA